MTTILSVDDVCQRLSLSLYRFGLLLKEGALPRARVIEGRTGWEWEDIEGSSFVRDPDLWTAKEWSHYGPNCVYYIAVGEFVKVGFTGQLQGRLSQLSCCNPYPVELLYTEPGDETLESFRHWELRDAAHRGEWFHRNLVERFIERLKNEKNENKTQFCHNSGTLTR